MKPDRVLIPLVCLILGAPALSFARQLPDASQSAKFHFGPLALTPRLAIQSLGVDTNVFNASELPVRDTTAALTPGLDAWLRAGRVLLSSKTTVDWLYYQSQSSQRSLNIGENWRVDVDVTRAIPRIVGLYVHTRQRPNDEIDTRVEQKNVGGGVGVTVPAGSRFKFELDARRTRYDYAQGEFGDPGVAQALNRDSDELILAGRVELTVLTSLTVRAESIRDRFQFTPERNSDSLRVMSGVTFQPFGAVSGTAFIGMRRFTTISGAVPEYSGVVAAMDLRYVALDRLRITGQLKRDVDYSVDLNEPFFVSTSAGVEVMQAVSFNWDVVGRFRRGSLAYQQTPSGTPGRTDRVRLVGAGLGWRVGTDFRVGFDADYVQRTSSLDSRAYAGFRFGGSVTYGY